MTRREAWIGGIAAALGALGAWLWVAGGDRGSVAQGVRGGSAETSALAPPKTQTLDAVEESADATGGVRADARVEPSARDARTASLYVPDFGAALQRAAASAVFELRDARGAPLEAEALTGPGATAELRRKTRSGWSRRPVGFDGSRLVCSGPDGAGLPPGEYVLEVRAGPYGDLEAPFELVRDEKLERTLEFPRWRRVVRLELADWQGTRLTKITQRPRYAFDPPARAVRSARGAAGPAALLAGVGAADASSPLVGSSLGWEAYYLTDEGSFCVRVFAGLPARLSLELEPALYGRRTIEFESDFTGPEWDSFQVVLEPLPDLDSRMSSWVCVNPDDPGSRSLLQAPTVQVARAPDPWDLSGMLPHRFRVIVEVDAPAPVRMLSEAGLPIRAPGDVWYLDVQRIPDADSLRIRYAFTDDFLFHAAPRPLDLKATDLSAAIVRDRVRLEGAAIEFEVTPPTPTLAAWATRAQLSIAGDPPWTERAATLVRGADGVFRVRSALSAADASALATKAQATIRFQAGDERVFATRRNFDDAQRALLLGIGGTLSFPVAAGEDGGLVCRLVDRDLLGVADAHVVWVDETRVGPVDELLALVRQDNDAARRASETGAPPPMDEGAAARARDFARRLVERAGGSGQEVAASDGFGYVVDDRVRLAASRRHALVAVWIDNHGALRDHFVRFVSSEGVQDLGAVRLP
jgi:hypothetical protein